MDGQQRTPNSLPILFFTLVLQHTPVGDQWEKMNVYSFVLFCPSGVRVSKILRQELNRLPGLHKRMLRRIAQNGTW